MAIRRKIELENLKRPSEAVVTWDVVREMDRYTEMGDQRRKG
jgi:hypothetical protein